MYERHVSLAILSSSNHECTDLMRMEQLLLHAFMQQKSAYAKMAVNS